MKASRRLLSSEDGKTLLSLPIESRWPGDGGGGREPAEGELHGLHHRFRSQQLLRRRRQPPPTHANATITDARTPTPGSTPVEAGNWNDGGRGRGRGKRRRRLEETSPRFPLTSSFGTHFVNAQIGTPPQRVSLIVDTGSYTTAFPCVGCTKCKPGSKRPFWDPSLSKTVTALGCDDCKGEYK
ncbi:unnamed protein product [Hapterophycus canaliculatus]